MKKWLFLLLGIGLLVGILLRGSGETPIEVGAVRIIPQKVEQTVSCTGLVEAVDSTPLVFPFSCVMKSIVVKEGQRVQKGDVLAVIDKEATKEVITTEGLLSLAALNDKITAPADGVVMTIEAVQGEILSAGVPCVVLVCDRDLRVRIAIPEKYLQDLEQGMTARVTGSGFGGMVYSGILSEIAASAQTDLGGVTTVHGVVSLDNPNASLRVGLNAKVSLLTQEEEQALILPFEAVQTDDAGSYVYVVRNGCARRLNIDNSIQTGKGVWVACPELDGAIVVTQPEKITSDGQAVREVLS